VGPRFVWALLVIGALIAGAAVYMVVYRPAVRGPAEGPAERPTPMEVHRPTSTVRVFLPKQVGANTYLVPMQVKVQATEDLPRVAMEQLIAASEEQGAGVIPKGTRVLDARTRGSVAEVNLSREFVRNFSGDARHEALTLNAILHTMAQFPGVRRTRILVDGKSVETLGGHLEILDPVAPDPAWLESSGSR